MLRRHLFAQTMGMALADAATAFALFFVLRPIGPSDATWASLWQALGLPPLVGAAAWAAAWILVLWSLGLYAHRVRWTLRSELEGLIAAAFFLSFATMSFLFLTRLDVSRTFIVLLLIGQPVVSLPVRAGLRQLYAWTRRRGSKASWMLVVGTGETAEAFGDSLESHHDLGIRVLGHVLAPGEGAGAGGFAVSRPILGSLEDLPRIFHERIVDEVAVCAWDDREEWLGGVVALAGQEGKHVRLVTVPRPERELPSEEMDGMLIRSYVHGPTRMASLAAKRWLDVVGAIVGLIVLSPVLLAAALAILVLDGRPIVFRQTRVAFNGRTFQMVKFRTMVPDAEARLDEVRALNRISGPAIQVDNDPRVTRSGAFLRKTSIDELPQLWNVLKGEMSLIGPRPAPIVEVNGYDIWHRRRLSMRPGITGLAQVANRRYSSFDQRAELDLQYIDRWSLALDVELIVRTIKVVLAGSGR